MKKLLVYFLIVTFTTVLIGCASEDDDGSVSTGETTDTRASVVSDSLIDIPSSISDTTTSSSTSGLYSKSLKVQSTAPTTEDQPVWGIYEGIRDNVGALEQWTGMIQELTVSIYSIIGRASSGDWSDNSGGTDGLGRIVWGPDTVNGYDHKMELYFSGVKGFEAYLSVDESAETARGIYTWDLSVVPTDEESSTSKIQFIFDSSTSPKQMEMKITNMSAADSSGPKNAQLKVTQSSDHVITLWGNYYFQDMDMFEDSSGDAAQDRNYVFAATGYDEIGQNDVNKNRAILELAMPKSDLTTTTDMWTNSSVSAVFVDKIKEVWTDMGLTDTTIDLWTGLNTSPTSIADYTYDDVIDILEWASVNDGTGDSLDDLVYVTKMVNPAYFDSTGFVATCLDASSDGTCDQGTEAGNSVPTGYDDLSIGTVADDVVAPATVRDLTVEFL